MVFSLALQTYCSLASAAPSNSVTIYDTSNSTQTNRPITISRVFAQGEITSYAQPMINGAGVATWQCDKKTSWSDGSLSHAIVSLIATIPANGSVTISFANSTASSSAGSALTQSQMVNFNGGSWGADMELTGGATCQKGQLSGNTCAANPKTMLNAGNWRYWLQGPVVTQVIAEDRSAARAYDMGWDTYAPIHPMFILTFYPSYTSGVKVDGILENDWTTTLEDQTYNVAMKSGSSLNTTAYSQNSVQHWAKGRFRQTFWSGTPLGSILTDSNLAYMAYSKAISNFDVTRVVGSSAVKSEVANWTSGSGYVPFTFNSANSSAGQISTYMGATGGREEIGLYPDWVVRWLYAMSNKTNNAALYPQLIGNAEISGQIPWHYRESGTGRNYLDSALDPSHTYSAFGRPLSKDSRPNLSVDNPNNVNQGAGIDDIPAVGAITCQASCGYPVTATGGINYWSTDIAHHPQTVYVPYLVTGDYYYLEELQFLGSWLLGVGNPQCGANYQSCGAHTLINEGGIQTRGMAWSFRSLAEAAFVSPDKSPERSYFVEKLNNNIQVKEGQYGIQTGAFFSPNPGGNSTTPCPNFNPSTSTIWCIGYLVFHSGSNVGTAPAPNPLALPMNWATDSNSTYDQNPATSGGGNEGYWQYWYSFASWNHARELGFNIGPFLTNVAKAPIHMALDPNFIPALATTYRNPVVDTNGNFFTTWAAVKNGYFINGTLTSAAAPTDTIINVVIPGYSGSDSIWDNNAGYVMDIDSEKMVVCNTISTADAQFNVGTCPDSGYYGRGFGGSIAAAHAPGANFTLDPNFMPYTATAADLQNGYGTMFLAILANVADASDSGYTGLAAYNRVLSIMPPNFQSAQGSNNASCNQNNLGACDNPKWAFVPRVTSAQSGGPNPCDLNGDGIVNASDVQLAASQALGTSSCSSLANITGNCTVVGVQRVVDASLGGSCQVGQ